MSFLSPWSALIASAVAIPLLLLLYVLRLRRQRLRIASTLLWQKSYEDLQANVPFQRLRWSLLLLLQLLLLALLLLALAEPVIRGEAATSSRLVLLIDRSASMNAVAQEASDDEPARRSTRLDLAKAAALEMVDRLGETGATSHMMVIAFGSTPRVVSSFESDRSALRDAIESIQPSDEQANLEAALDLAGAFAQRSDEAAAAQTTPPLVLLLSDGGVGASDQAFTLRAAGDFEFVQIIDPRTENAAQASNNVGIVSFSARRDYDDPARVLIFARLINANPAEVDAVITLAASGEPVMTTKRSLPGATENAAGELSISHELVLAEGAALTLRHNVRDRLAADDVAALVLPAPARPRIALIQPATGTGADDEPAGPNAWARDLLQATLPQKLDVMSPEAFANIDVGEIDSGSMYELIVFDRVAPARLPGVPSLTFGAAPAAVREVQAEDPERGQLILSWDRQHPLMRHVSLDTVVYSGFGALELPSTATPLAFGPQGPVIALLQTRGARHVVVGFALNKSNWPLHISSAIFIQNVIEFLTLANSGQNGLAVRPGEPVTVRAQADTTELVISTGGAEAEGEQLAAAARIAVDSGESVTLPAFSRVGLYRVRGVRPPHDLIAVNLASEIESDTRLRDSVTVNAQSAAGGSVRGLSRQPLWPWLMMAAVVVLVLEWLVYCWRIRGG